MEAERIELGTFRTYSNLVEDYLNQGGNDSLFPLPFSKRGLLEAAKTRKFSSSNREILIDALKNQYKNADIAIEGPVSDQIERLRDDKTYTITTGHQLCLFTGPLYFIIKILQTIKLADQMNSESEEYQFVPVFWLASEDHDFAEINHAHLFGKTISWPDAQGGKVGAYNLDSIDPIVESMNEILGKGENAEYLKKLFKDSYSKSHNLVSATRNLVHELFSERGLIILDGDDVSLKRQFTSHIKKEISEKVIFSEHTDTLKNFGNKYKIQVNPRPINLFYLDTGKRSLIEEKTGEYKLKDQDKTWTKEKLLNEVEEHPERFSPNVVLRPLYQEKILPNICYVGGQAEISYWLQLESSFERFQLPFPLLNLRNSIMWLDKPKLKKLNKLKVTIQDLFIDESLITKKLVEFEHLDESFDRDIDDVNKAFQAISSKIENIDASMKPLVLAEGRKIEKQLEQLKGRILKAEKVKNEERLNSFWNLYEKVFPGGSLHERYDNFAPYFLTYGWSFFDHIYEQIDPEESRLILIKDI